MTVESSAPLLRNEIQRLSAEIERLRAKIERLRSGLEKIRDYPDRSDVSDNLAKSWLRIMAGKILRNESVE
jgi:predicted RNase H-like nuclease (RuvC/YqgF family)